MTVEADTTDITTVRMTQQTASMITSLVPEVTPRLGDVPILQTVIMIVDLDTDVAAVDLILLTDTIEDVLIAIHQGKTIELMAFARISGLLISTFFCLSKSFYQI